MLALGVHQSFQVPANVLQVCLHCALVMPVTLATVRVSATSATSFQQRYITELVVMSQPVFWPARQQIVSHACAAFSQGCDGLQTLSFKLLTISGQEDIAFTLDKAKLEKHGLSMSIGHHKSFEGSHSQPVHVHITLQVSLQVWTWLAS